MECSARKHLMCNLRNPSSLLPNTKVFNGEHHHKRHSTTCSTMSTVVRHSQRLCRVTQAASKARVRDQEAQAKETGVQAKWIGISHTVLEISMLG